MSTRTPFMTALAIAALSTTLAAPALAYRGTDLRSPDAADAATSSPAFRQDRRTADAVDAVQAGGAAERAAMIPIIRSARPVVIHDASGFDWASAAVGAGAAAGGMVIVLGGGVALRRRRATTAASVAVR
jgi:hypothetical protein